MTRDDVPNKHRGLYDRALQGHFPGEAIKAHCIMCMGWRAELVEGCSAPTCPLYPYRQTGRGIPYQRSKAIRTGGAKNAVSAG